MVIPHRLSILARCLPRPEPSAVAAAAAAPVCRHISTTSSRDHPARNRPSKPSPRTVPVRRARPSPAPKSFPPPSSASPSPQYPLPPRHLIVEVVDNNSDTYDLMSADEYYLQLQQVAQRIARRPSAAQPPSQMTHPPKLPAPAVLHDLGCVVLTATRGRAVHLAMMLWEAAATHRQRASEPALLSLAAHLVWSDGYGTRDRFRPVEWRFEALDGPVAVAIRAERLLRRGDHERAEKMLRRVLAANNPPRDDSDSDDHDDDAVYFAQWESNARLALAKVLVARGKDDEAETVLRRLAAVEGGAPPETALLLGRLLLRRRPRTRADEDEAMQYLYTAACSGVLQAYQEMAVVELERAARAESPGEMDEHQRWADEYALLADKNLAMS